MHLTVNRPHYSRWLLALFFVVAGVMHFVFPAAYARIMPVWLGWHSLLVFVSGVAECLGGLGIFWDRSRRLAAWGLLILCVAVLPANVQMLINAWDAHQSFWIIVLLIVRLPLQALLMRWIWVVAKLPNKTINFPT